MSRKKILVIGAGLAGLSAARHLKHNGIACTVLEKEQEPGGLCRSKNVRGFTFDCDGHLLHFKHPSSFALVNRLLGGNLREHRRSAWVYSYGRFCRYPFQANLYGLPPSVVKECLLGLMERPCAMSRRSNAQETFLDWTLRTFGRGIARHFMVPYNTKFWTLPLRDLTCEWLQEVVPVPSVSQIVEGTLRPSRKQYGYNARFWYPRQGGIQQLPAALARDAGDIRIGCRVAGIDPRTKTVVLSSGAKERYDCLIATAPLPEMAGLIKGMPLKVRRLCGQLRWNSIYNINLGLERGNDLKAHWVYFPQKDTRFFRVGFFDNISRTLAPEGKSALYVEAAYSRGRPIEKKSFARCVRKDLEKIGLLRRGEKIAASDINDIEYGYPIYDIRYATARNALLRYLEGHKIFPAGRYGWWRYFSMEDAILDGMRAAKAACAHV